MLRAIASYIEKNSLLEKGDTVIAGLSGGADSICMTHILCHLGYQVIAAHCNFSLRGSESDRDQKFVEDFCYRNSIELHTTRFDTTFYATEHKLGIEEAARELRYRWFEELRRETGAAAICVAHHRDDSIETSLLNRARGTGITGICGIRCRNGRVVRPLLGVSRTDIEEYLNEQELSYVTDSTNLETHYNRNKIRNIIIPEFQKIKPGFCDTMAANIENFTAVNAIYQDTINREKERVLTKKENTLYINLNRVTEFVEPATLLYEILQHYGLHPREIPKLLTMERGKQVNTSTCRISIIRDKGSRLLMVENVNY